MAKLPRILLVAALLTGAFSIVIPLVADTVSVSNRAGSVAAAAVVPRPATTLSPIDGACTADVTGEPGAAPAVTIDGGAISGTSTADLDEFAAAFNRIRIANCLQPIAMEHFVYDSCLEARLIWMAEDPSDDPSSAWGHLGSVRSDGLPSVGCDGNLAGGDENTGASVAQKWWDSAPHREALYRPTSTQDTSEVCIAFAMTHGGVPTEPKSFVRAAARWLDC